MLGEDRLVLRTRHTAELAPDDRHTIRALLDSAFAGQFTDEDWDHGLGGMHAIVEVGGRTVAHGALVPRRLLHRGRAWRCGYVENVAVDAAYRRRGLGGEVMTALESLAPGYDLLALSASDTGARLYLARGWRRWRGPTSVLTPAGVRPTPEDDGSTYVLPGSAPLDLDGELTCDWREGDVW